MYVRQVGSNDTVANRGVFQLRTLEKIDDSNYFDYDNFERTIIELDNNYSVDVAIAAYDHQFLEVGSDRMYFNSRRKIKADDLKNTKIAFRIEKVVAPHVFRDRVKPLKSIIEHDIFQIQNVHSALVLDVPERNKQNGIKIIQFSANDESNQKWICLLVGEYCLIQSRSTKKCLSAIGQHITQQPCQMSDYHQQFLWKYSKKYSFTIHPRNAVEKCLQVQDRSTATSALIVVAETCTSDDHQRWFVRSKGRIH